ncbi:MAG: S8 family serine peptidase [Bacteroidales bacterium]|nr:S8 family serine peptidase [Bacteroidales bacterium]
MKKSFSSALYVISTLLILVTGCVNPYLPDIDNGHLLTKSQSEKKFYYAFDKKKYIIEIPTKVAVSIDEKYLLETERYLQRNTQVQDIAFQVNRYHCICFLTLTTEADANALITDLKKQKGVKSVYHAHVLAEFSRSERYMTDEFVVQFKDHVPQNEINEMHNLYSVKVLKITELYHLLSVPVDVDLLEVANAYQESGLVNFSHPNALSTVVLNQSLPSDPFFINQFYLHNTGQGVNGRPSDPGADINIVNAWNITKGNSNIVVAVIDDGVSSDHPDLPNARQVRLWGSNFAAGSIGDPSPNHNDNHGNACAGIIAASHNNEGIAGIAPNCKIMPIRIPFGFKPSPSIYADAIMFAKNNGADIISICWSYFFESDPNHEPAIVSAISSATTTGRGGKGCVVVIAAGNRANQIGNDPGLIEFPANVQIPGVLTVGASDRNDYQANYSPTSNLNSTNNQIIDVVAPSHKAYSDQIIGEDYDVWTIDIPGYYGYNPDKGTSVKLILI